MLFKCLILTLLLLDLKLFAITILSIHLILLALDKQFFPFLTDACTEGYNEMADPFKKKLFQELQSMKNGSTSKLRILEVGGGSGANLKYYQVPAIIDILEPNPNFEYYFKKNAANYKELEVNPLTQGFCEDLLAAGFDNDCFDIVISTLVLCSVNDQNKCYEEIHRVLKPGGKFLYVEHVYAEQTSFLKTMQKVLMIGNFWQFLNDGCCLDRNTDSTIKAFSKWSKVEQEKFDLPFSSNMFHRVFNWPITPHVMGYAQK